MSGIVEPLHDGFPTTISIGNNELTTYAVWEDEVQPPGYEGGEPINVSNMRSSEWLTKAPQHLKDTTPVQVTVAYDPTALDEVQSLINQNQSIVTTMPDGATITWWGYMKSFIPGPHRKGEQPKAAVTLIPTNRNADGEETGPVIVEGSGTGA